MNAMGNGFVTGIGWAFRHAGIGGNAETIERSLVG